MCGACDPKEKTRQVIEQEYPPKKKPKAPSPEWDDIEYKKPTY
jgi:hypothetical protein